jgi:hypothetical protein
MSQTTDPTFYRSRGGAMVAPPRRGGLSLAAASSPARARLARARKGHGRV